MEREKLYAAIEWGVMTNGKVLESQMIVTDNKEEAIKHGKEHKLKNTDLYVEEYWSDEPNNTKVVWGNKENYF